MISLRNLNKIASFGRGLYPKHGFNHQLLLQQCRGYKAPLNELQFLVEDVFNFPQRYQNFGYDQNLVNKETISSVLNETAKFAESELAPLDASGDTHGCQYLGPHDVRSPPGYKEAYEKYRQGDWIGLSYPKKFGGQDLPHSLSLFHSEILGSACQPWSSYVGLSKGAIRTLIAHGNQEVQDLFVHKMVSGEWMGTMCLTEPHCGSDLNQVSTRADKLEDGRYSINGTKIFITCGEHDITPNIIHLVLARIPGGPSGTHGISLFAVPKHLPEGNELQSEYNGVNIGRIEDKMGYHGTPTCEIHFENAVGYLVGREHKGMAHMFTFMNGARIGASMMGVNAAEKSFQNSLQYAKTRRAFRAAKGNIDTSHAADPIIVHPDIRRMLLTQKAIAEGGRAMLYASALMNDQLLKETEIGNLESAHLLEAQLGFATPILKGFLTERGIEAANLGIQIYGGHGYIKGNHQEQILRDTRISAIWEGTTGIQALDLLRRKVFAKGLDDMTVITSHCVSLQDLCKTVVTHTKNPDTKRHAEMLHHKSEEWIELTRRISVEAKKDPNALGLASVDYLMYSGYITLAEHWLIMEENASLCIANPNRTQSLDFYETKLKMSKFVFFNLLPRVEHHKLSALAKVETLMDIPPESFSFDY